MDFEALEVPTSDEPVLAKWHCNADLWGRFKQIEPFNAGMRSAIYLMTIPMVVSAAVVLLLVWASLLRYLAWSTSLEAGIILVALAGIFVVSGLIYWLSVRSLAEAMKTETGEVIIALDGFSINGQRFFWRFGPKGLKYGRMPRFRDGERKTVGESSAASLDILEFRCSATSLTNHGFETETIIRRRVPVPLDRTAEADAALERLNLRARSEEWS